MRLQAANFRLSHRFVVLNASGKEVSTAGTLRPRVHGWHCSQPGGSAQELALLCSSEAAALPPTATVQCELRVDQPLALDTVGGGCAMLFLGAAGTEGAVLCNTQALVTKGAGGRGEEIPRGPVMHVDIGQDVACVSQATRDSTEAAEL